MIQINSAQQMQLAQAANKSPFQATSKQLSSFTPQEAYSLQPAANYVTNIIEQRPLSKERTANRRPIATPGSQTGKAQMSLVQETHNVPMQLGDKLGGHNVFEVEDRNQV